MATNQPCKFLYGNGKTCGTIPVVAEYQATRGPMPICTEHERLIVRTWPNAPIR